MVVIKQTSTQAFWAPYGRGYITPKLAVKTTTETTEKNKKTVSFPTS
jgi:hypothetical protein